MTFEEGLKYRYNIFDITKNWPNIPLKYVGLMILNRNPGKFFDDVEQVAFSPGNFIPGIEPSNDKLLLGRMFAYPDT